MDSVRFGRALGIGARSAARALAGAAVAATDAATAPNPGQPSRPSAPSQTRPAADRPIASAAQSAARSATRATTRAATQTKAARKGFAEGRKRFGEAIWGPFAKLSRVLWLEMTGFFFGIFAVFAGHAVWASRADFRSVLHPAPANYDARIHLLVFLIMALAFSYFCISSFVRAYRR